ncbi:Histone-lysine N-methyltransferase SETMAR [Eumeta japonica]|uniref:Histone-lysine N-methyltransferase SETMAR n=1 Tax=Eumeta variegata TaxID=151549 RepID=A0A4C1U448_EUMVA|nr:Histone-lysine N-methyltransferase SETMAR [Eumeta japonica]
MDTGKARDVGSDRTMWRVVVSGYPLKVNVGIVDEYQAQFYSHRSRRLASRWTAAAKPPAPCCSNSAIDELSEIAVLWYRRAERAESDKSHRKAPSQGVEQKRPGLINRKDVVFHHDNARANTFSATQQILREFAWNVLMHPPYSPDLAPSDFHLFRPWGLDSSARADPRDGRGGGGVPNVLSEARNEWSNRCLP